MHRVTANPRGKVPPLCGSAFASALDLFGQPQPSPLHVSDMSDDSAWRSAVGLERAQADLLSRGFALTNDRAIGLPAGHRENFAQRYYNPETLHRDPGDFPIDRERARDVIRYWWCDDALKLEPFDRITITDRAEIAGKREHSRVLLLKDPGAELLISTLLRLVPRDLRQPDGTFGVNLFRTYTNVVTKPHHDDEQYVILYILDRIGDGAETSLYRPEDVTADGRILADPVLTQQLNRGDIFIFDDKAYKHGTTPLISPPDGNARRDALVCTVDQRTTYLAN
jgi:2OG-Fe dioxygenase